MTITTAQIRGARGILNWSQHDLSERTGISATSIGSIENGQSIPRENTLNAITKAFEMEGIEFLAYEGVRLQNNVIQNLTGKDGFQKFLDDVYNSIISYGTESKPVQVYLSNVKHENWIKVLGEESWKRHADRMKDSKSLMDVRILVKEGDTKFPASEYAQYKWLPTAKFNDKSIYSYHDKLAFIDFKVDTVDVVIIRQPSFADGYRSLFQIAWESLAKEPTNITSKKAMV
jgi:transcriptional regulator with XRE-family HTH domain